jgi:hypothetical protein
MNSSLTFEDVEANLIIKYTREIELVVKQQKSKGPLLRRGGLAVTASLPIPSSSLPTSNHCTWEPRLRSKTVLHIYYILR